jgi:hypothetical protein
LRDDSVVQAVVEFGTAVYGNCRSAGGMDGCDEFDCVPLHYLDFSKGMVALDEWRGLQRVFHDAERPIAPSTRLLAVSIPCRRF